MTGLADLTLSDFVAPLSFTQPPAFIEFSLGGKVPVLTFKYDGTIEVGEGYTPTEAGDAFLEYTKPMFARMIATLKETV